MLDASLINSAAAGPMIWTPRISPYFLSAMTFTKPWAASDAIARPLAAKLNLPMATSYFSELVLLSNLLLLLQEECVDSCRSQIQLGNSMISFGAFSAATSPIRKAACPTSSTVDVTWCVDTWNRSFHVFVDLDTSTIQFKLNITNSFRSGTTN